MPPWWWGLPWVSLTINTNMCSLSSLGNPLLSQEHLIYISDPLHFSPCLCSVLPCPRHPKPGLFLLRLNPAHLSKLAQSFRYFLLRAGFPECQDPCYNIILITTIVIITAIIITAYSWTVIRIFQCWHIFCTSEDYSKDSKGLILFLSKNKTEQKWTRKVRSGKSKCFSQGYIPQNALYPPVRSF